MLYDIEWCKVINFSYRMLIKPKKMLTLCEKTKNINILNITL